MNEKRKSAMLIASASALAFVLTLFNAVPARSQAVVLTAARVEAGSLDPNADVWNSATPVDLPLSQQAITPPRGGGSIAGIRARALHDDKQLYILAEWNDATMNDDIMSTQGFRDAVAVQFPTQPGALPFVCMGQLGNAVNIWQWKAEWERDLAQGYVGVDQRYTAMHVDNYLMDDDPTFRAARYAGNILAAEHKTSVENLNAGGFGTLKTASAQNVAGKGIWKDGKWRVVFARDLTTPNSNEARFASGTKTSIAFAVWDGAQMERDGMKSVSQFVDLELSTALVSPLGGILFLGTILVGAAALAARVLYLSWKGDI